MMIRMLERFREHGMKRFFIIGISALLLLAPQGANAENSFVVPTAGEIEVAFSPNEGSEQLVLKVIDSAKSEIKMLAYSFTSTPVVKALVQAKKKGVSISLVVDHKGNQGAKSRAALSILVNVGCDVRTITAYQIHHDKVIIADKQTIELGSFNYSASAANKNSENVLVIWNNPKLAEKYIEHFERNQQKATAYQLQY